MNTSQTSNFRKALLAFSFVGMLLASTANSKVVGSVAVANFPTTAITNAAPQALGAFNSTEPAVLEAGHTSSVALPPLAVLGPSQKWGSLFPIVGLVAAVAVTQLLRRRRIAQLRSDSSLGQ